MIITRIKINKVEKTEKGLVGFASIVLDNKLFLNNIAIFKRLDSEKIRLVFPEKVSNEKKIKIFFPMTADFYKILEEEVEKKFLE